MRPLSVGLALGKKHAIRLIWLVSFAFFILLFALLSFTPHDESDTFLVSTLSLVIVAIYAFPSADIRFKFTPWRWVPLFASSLSIVLGVAFGEYNFSVSFAPFLRLDGGKTYTSVLPTNRATLYRDGSLFSFSHNSFVDESRVYAFRQGDSLYCVAPFVSDAVSTQRARMSFWAVGLDCCSVSGDGFWCTDEELSLRKRITKSTGILATFLNRKDERIFRQAARAGASRYGTFRTEESSSSEDDVILLHLKTNPSAAVLEIRNRAIRFFLLYGVLIGGGVYGALFAVARPHAARKKAERSIRQDTVYSIFDTNAQQTRLTSFD